MKKLLAGLTVGMVMFGMAGVSGATTIITSFQTGEVFDGQKGPLDGIGDAQYNNISSYFGINYIGTIHTRVTWVGQAMAYFDLTPIAGQNITSALFQWSAHHTQGDGAPSITGVYGMLNNPGLSLDDFNSGSLWGTVSTADFYSGDVVVLDITSYLNSFSGTSLGLNLSSLDATGNTFMNMNYLGATITFENGPAPVPEPATMLLFGTGLTGLIGTRLRKKSKK